MFKGQVQVETADSTQEAGEHCLPASSRSQEHRGKGMTSYKENLASLKVVSNKESKKYLQ